MKDCEYYREKISCLIDGELSPDETAELEAHIAECSECRALYDAFTAVSAAVSGGMEEPPESIAPAVMQEVRAIAGRKKRGVWIKCLSAAACLALVRGPCISSGMDKVYMEILHEERKAEKLHDIYWNATKETLGVLIYQEQILKICTNIGFDGETAYNILKAVSKKKMEKIAAFKEKFLELGKAKDITGDVLLKIWKRIQDSGLYAFNVAHAVSYALLSYESAWLKYHYPLEYMCNLLTKEAGQGIKKDTLDKVLIECRKLGIEFLPPDINKSEWGFTIEDGKIRIGYCAVKGIGEAVYRKIKEAGYIKSFNDFLERAVCRTVNKKSVLLLVLSGMFDSLEEYSPGKLAEFYMKEIRKEQDWDGRVNIGLRESISFFAAKSDIYKKLLGSAGYNFGKGELVLC